MNTMNKDLFPETLLVSREGDHVFTTSLKVAEHFHKRHDTVLRAIRTLIEATQDEVSRRNFAERDYVDGRGKTQPMYELTHDGFAVAAMSFTGPEALEWKWKFLAAFRDMERQIAAFREREANALYAIRPRWRPIIEHPELRRDQLTALTGHKSAGSITACRRKMRQIGLLDS